MFFCVDKVIAADNVTVSSLALIVPSGSSSRPRLALGKGSGQVSVCEFDSSWICTQRVDQSMAHDQVVSTLSLRMFEHFRSLNLM